MALDRTSDATDERRFLSLHQSTISSVAPKTHFSESEATALALIYFKIVKDEETMSSQNFSKILHYAFGISDQRLIGRVFYALGGLTLYVELKDWLTSLSLFLRGTLNEKIVYCFKVYDLMGRGEINREQMLSLLKDCIIKPYQDVSDEAVKDLVDIIIKKVDVSDNGFISFEDYKKTVEKDPLFLEFLGPCLPDRLSVHSFLATFTDRFHNF